MVYKTPYGAKYHQELYLNDALEKGLAPCKICISPNFINKGSYEKKNPKGESCYQHNSD